MSLDRFKTAQAAISGGFDAALAELRSGRKTGHWIWYIFPQIGGLGHSAMSQYYALRDASEACDYLRDPLLRKRLLLAAEAVATQLASGTPLVELMGGSVDSLKLVSSLTLFELAARQVQRSAKDPTLDDFLAQCEAILGAAGAMGFPRCAHTLRTWRDSSGRGGASR
jgi:uncharacterized protein (DUF1810 family)